MYSIRLRYCGGCNPQIDRSGVITSLKKALRKMGIEANFTADRQGTVDLVLLINGCTHACLEEAYPKEDYATRVISIKGEMVENSFIEEKRIPKFLSEKICKLSRSFPK